MSREFFKIEESTGGQCGYNFKLNAHPEEFRFRFTGKEHCEKKAAYAIYDKADESVHFYCGEHTAGYVRNLAGLIERRGKSRKEGNTCERIRAIKRQAVV